MTDQTLAGIIVDPRAARCQDLAAVAQETTEVAFDAWISLGRELVAQRELMPGNVDFGAWCRQSNNFGCTSQWLNRVAIASIETQFRTDVRDINRLYKLGRQRAKALAAPPPPTLPDEFTTDMRFGDFRDVLTDITPDAIITDPPYPAEYLPLYEDLANWAEDVLPDHGILAIMVGQSYLPELFNLLSGHLPYRWTMAYLTPGGQATQLWQRNVNTFWKPILIYGQITEHTPWIGDVTRSDVNDNDKDHHHWGQSVSGMVDLVERLTQPGHLIADPFAGAGTTGVAAALTQRHFVGCDIDPAHVNTARARLT